MTDTNAQLPDTEVRPVVLLLHLPSTTRADEVVLSVAQGLVARGCEVQLATLGYAEAADPAKPCPGAPAMEDVVAHSRYDLVLFGASGSWVSVNEQLQASLEDESLVSGIAPSVLESGDLEAAHELAETLANGLLRSHQSSLMAALA